MTRYQNIGWWFWSLMAAILAGATGGYIPALRLALVLGVVQVFHYLTRHKRLSAFPVQGASPISDCW